MASTRDFYKDLPVIDTFEGVTDTARHHELPDDWVIVITDVIGSTKAIEAGKYKSVNTVGVAGIAAVLNVDRNLEIPFVFGGDGATFAIPGEIRERVTAALLGAKNLARDGFGLDLRLGMVPVSSLRAANHWVRLAKVKMSENVVQAAFSGRGWEEAERLVKSPGEGSRYCIRGTPGIVPEANFEGFECRWQGVGAFRGHKMSLLVLGMSDSPEENVRIYTEVIRRIHAIFGDVEDFHPLRKDRLELVTNPAGYSAEAEVRQFGKGSVQRLRYLIRAFLLSQVGRFLFHFGIDTRAVKWSRYKSELVENSDFRKFDGTLRMVIDGSDAQIMELERYLQEQMAAKNLVYGLNRSREALVTCLIWSYSGNHTHFIDGSDGGYALAARQLKQNLEALKS